MPEIKISEFPELNTPILTDVIPILDLSETDPSVNYRTLNQRLQHQLPIH